MKSHIDPYLDYLKFQKRYSNHTLVAYKNDLYTFSDFIELCFEVDKPAQVTSTFISSFLADQIEFGNSSRTVNRKLSAIQSFFDWLVREEQVSSNPAKSVTRPKQHSKLPTVLRSEEVSQLLEEDLFEEDFEGKRDRLILMMLYACGLRRDELIHLRISSVDQTANQIKVLGKRNKERIIPISRQLLFEVEQYSVLRDEIGAEDSFLFITSKGKKMYPSLVYNVVKNYLSKVTTQEKRSPHVLRHTFATHLLNEGANLQSIKELLGHSSLAATQVYTHTSLEKLKDVYRKSHPRNKN